MTNNTMSTLVQPGKTLSSSQQMLLALKEAKRKLEVAERAKREPIAVIGMSCRFPGAPDPAAFWQLLHHGVDAISEAPADRWDVAAYYDPNPETPGKMYTTRAGFLDQVDQFDPQFFKISPREAVNMDPQQRLLLEVSWEALENAGQLNDRLSNSATGVFVGITINDYGHLLRAKGLSELDAYFMSGNALNSASGRLSYMLGLQGPSMAIDTACSSSLVALHLACQSLRNGECRQALAGGTNAIIHPEGMVVLCQARMLAADGRCKTFDARADGYVRGEGCGIVVLKRLSDALADGDNILALIRGSAVNQDGPSSGFTVPNGAAQQALIGQTLTRARVAPREIDYVEAHGTGTSLGDPIEVRALAAALGQERSKDRPLHIGSVKTNIGHLESAAGISSVIKVILALQQREIPPHLHFETPNPYIDWANLPLVVPTTLIPWPDGDRQLAGVSSFGVSGTNAHLILEAAPAPAPAPSSDDRPTHLFTLSAKTEGALDQLVQRYAAHLTEQPETSLGDLCGDICYTAATGRRHFPHRISLISESTAALREKLVAFAAGQPVAGLSGGQVTEHKAPKVAFLFTGQGSQYVDMGRTLYETQPTFRQTLEHCDELLQPYLKRSILEIIYPDQRASDQSPQTDLTDTATTQPALFALEYALAEMWRAWGIKPDMVLGHSVGEYVAACVAGVFSLEDGLRLIAERGRLMGALPQNGAMQAVLTAEAQVKEAIAPYVDLVSIAAINGPQSVVVSGECEALTKIATSLAARGIKTRQLSVSHAFHSPLMEPILADFAQVAGQVRYASPKLPLISNVSGDLASDEVTDPAYWVQHIRRPVRFADGMATLRRQGAEIFVELGPQPVLLGMGQQALTSVGRQVPIDLAWLPSLRQNRSDWQVLLQSLGTLYCRGVAIDWAGFEQDYTRRKVVLPTYPFQRRRYWVEAASNGSPPASKAAPVAETPLLDLLQRGDPAQLARYLGAAEPLSPEQEKILELLAKRHRQEVSGVEIRDWFYELEWRSLPAQRSLAQTESLTEMPTHWLILADSQGVGHSLAERLRDQGATCLEIYAEEDYLTDSALSDVSFERLLADLPPSDTAHWHIIHLWSLDVAPSQTLSVDTLAEAQSLTCGSLLHLVQTLANSHSQIRAKLWIITQGVVQLSTKGDTSGDPVSVGQAPIWGLGRVIALEQPDLWGGLIDLPPQPDSETEQDMVILPIDLFTHPNGENQIALRQGKPYVARLVRSPLTPAEPVTCQAEGTYLVSGGLGALGLRVAQWLVEQGARHLLLTGRSGATRSEAQAAVEQLEQAGATVRVVKADVAKAEDVTRLLEHVEVTMPPLRGIVHAAGVLDDGMLHQQTWQRFSRVMAPKLRGSWLLHSLTQDHQLDFFVCFSSLASLLGVPGQGNYAAANAFLDALAQHRRATGQPGVSINWGPWAEIGMAARLGEGTQERMVAQGLRPIDPEQGMQALEQILSQFHSQISVLPIDWPVFGQQFGLVGRQPLLSDWIDVEEQRAQETRLLARQQEFLQRLTTLPAGEQRQSLMTYVQGELNQVLQFDSSQLPNPQQNFFDMGMDSLMAVELKNRLEQGLGHPLSTTLLFNYNNLESLVQYLIREVLALDGASQTSENRSSIHQTLLDTLDTVDQLSEGELMALIDEEFRQFG